MEVGALVKIVPSKYNKYIQGFLIEKELLGIITGFQETKDACKGPRFLVAVQWSDGSSSVINQIYLEVINEQ